MGRDVRIHTTTMTLCIFDLSNPSICQAQNGDVFQVQNDHEVITLFFALNQGYVTTFYSTRIDFMRLVADVPL